MIVGRSNQKQPGVRERVRAHHCLPADSESLQPFGATSTSTLYRMSKIPADYRTPARLECGMKFSSLFAPAMLAKRSYRMPLSSAPNRENHKTVYLLPKADNASCHRADR